MYFVSLIRISRVKCFGYKYQMRQGGENWSFGLVGNVVGRMDEVSQHRAQSVLGRQADR